MLLFVEILTRYSSSWLAKAGCFVGLFVTWQFVSNSAKSHNFVSIVSENIVYIELQNLLQDRE